jgi:hypothetical protein
VESDELIKRGSILQSPSYLLIPKNNGTPCPSLIFESGSRLSRIEKNTFSGTDLVEIILPASVEVLGEGCFAECRSLSWVTFESGSRFLGIEREILAQAGWFNSDE